MGVTGERVEQGLPRDREEGTAAQSRAAVAAIGLRAVGFAVCSKREGAGHIRHIYRAAAKGCVQIEGLGQPYLAEERADEEFFVKPATPVVKDDIPAVDAERWPFAPRLRQIRTSPPVSRRWPPA